jgi:hypothetical protein
MHITSATEVQIGIYSLSGRNIYRASEFKVAGEHWFPIKTAGLAQGAYLAQVKAGHESFQFRIIIGN